MALTQEHIVAAMMQVITVSNRLAILGNIVMEMETNMHAVLGLILEGVLLDVLHALRTHLLIMVPLLVVVVADLGLMQIVGRHPV